MQLEVAGEGVTLTAEDVVAQRTPKAGMVVASEGDAIVGLETARRLNWCRRGWPANVSRVQNLRKDADFEVTQRIAVTVECDADVKAAVARLTTM